jgi:hypothetical protein
MLPALTSDIRFSTRRLTVYTGRLVLEQSLAKSATRAHTSSLLGSYLARTFCLPMSALLLDRQRHADNLRDRRTLPASR